MDWDTAPASDPPGPSQRPDPPNPHTATDLAGFVTLLRQLWEWAGKPGFKKTLEAMARERVGVGALSGSTAHRVLNGQQDLAFMRDPERFVRAFVTTLGADAEPWLAVLNRLLNPMDQATTSEPPDEASINSLRSRHRWTVSRKAASIATAVVVMMMVLAGIVIWSVAEEGPAPALAVDYSRPAVIESGAADLRLAVDENADQPGARAVVLDSADAIMASWELVAPYRNNPDYRQLRPTGKLLMCLDVIGGSFQDRAPVQQWGCNGEPHQYWKVLFGPSGTVRFTNLNSGQCLSVASADPQAGMQLVQRECNDQQQAQQWRMTATDHQPMTSRSASASITPQAVGPDPAEYPGGGKDQLCEGLSPVLDPATTPWSNEPFLIRDEDPTRGKAALGSETAGAVELLRANRTNIAGAEETFYWAEGYVKFTPKQFTMALQWTTLPGPGGWHTCPITFTAEYGRPHTMALPRDSNQDGTRDVWFRICLSYQSENSADPIVNCAERY
ncbi:MAG: RICIN domain-containing protein [Actinomycetota bacterium]|nr:RICIN domain-containing protein [Actinomycetota bacterium]